MIVETKYYTDKEDRFFVASDFGYEYWIYGFFHEDIARSTFTKSDVGMWKIKKLK